MKQNPCRYCHLAFDSLGKKIPNWKDECLKCEYNKRHKEYLESQRKFVAGEQITTIDELLKQEWVIWNGSTRHIEVIKHNQLSTVLKMLQSGMLRYAIRRIIDE